MGLPRKLKNFVLFNNGIAHVGEVPEVNLPKLSRKMEDYRSGGMSGTVKLDFGMEAMEMEWTAAGYMKELFTAWGTLRHDGVLLRFAGALQAEKLLLLTDIYGGTPSNVAGRLITPGRIEAVAGVNLPMLVRALTYCHQPLDVVVSKAITGGLEGVLYMTPPDAEK